jgi:7-cyano-7-deazaguanine reductase
MARDLSHCAGVSVGVTLFALREGAHTTAELAGTCLDDLDIECTEYSPNADLLTTGDALVEETLHTNLLKSNCLVTGQPDWGSLEISYRGRKIPHDSVLKYIVSFRDHNEFGEHCVERIFCDISRICAPQWLKVYARYTRRGGLDINPLRVSRGSEVEVANGRLIRQ